MKRVFDSRICFGDVDLSIVHELGKVVGYSAADFGCLYYTCP
jgi:hypothetical protein